ncbi:unnamed protein product [Orchesella dallaii]|uniref:Uncharacterized protein n=1 Tax=Orchesella dallaii TaxID=48710 RepID=A0ABP1RUV7_9HEXA
MLLWTNWKRGEIASFSIRLVCITCLSAATILLWYLATKAGTCVKFLNGLNDLNLSDEPNDSQMEQSEFTVTKLLCHSFVLTDMVGPWIVGIACGLKSCSPPNLLVPLNPTCWSETVPESKAHDSFLKNGFSFLTLSMANGILWKVATGAGCTFCIHMLIGCSYLQRALTVSKFQTENYRRIQYSSKLFNEAYIGILFAMLVGSSMILTSMTYIMFRVLNSTIIISLPVSVWILIEIFDTVVVILYIFGQAGSLFSLSSQVLNEERSACLLGRANLHKRKVLRSCTPIRIEFGLSNFIDKVTPLKFVEFSIDRLVDLMLM